MAVHQAAATSRSASRVKRLRQTASRQSPERRPGRPSASLGRPAPARQQRRCSGSWPRQARRQCMRVPRRPVRCYGPGRRPAEARAANGRASELQYTGCAPSGLSMRAVSGMSALVVVVELIVSPRPATAWSARWWHISTSRRRLPPAGRPMVVPRCAALGSRRARLAERCRHWPHARNAAGRSNPRRARRFSLFTSAVLGRYP